MCAEADGGYFVARLYCEKTAGRGVRTASAWHTGWEGTHMILSMRVSGLDLDLDLDFTHTVEAGHEGLDARLDFRIACSRFFLERNGCVR